MITTTFRAILLVLATAGLLHAQSEGDAAAVYRDALRYDSGDGVLQDFAQAAALIRLAAEQGHPPAQNHLGRYYAAGRGVAQDKEAAHLWLERAAQTGQPDFVFDLAQLLEQSEDTLPEAATLYAQAAKAGSSAAALNLAFLYQEGRGVEQDFTLARQLYELAAQAGIPRALNNLGLIYVRAEGVEQNYELAANLFEQAAVAGLPEAMRNLGTLYQNAFGVELDEARAEALFRAAAQTGEVTQSLVYDDRLSPPATDEASIAARNARAEAGDPIARFQRALVTLTGPKTSYDSQAKAVHDIKDLAEQGHAPSMYNLAILYNRGHVVPEDHVLAYAWMVLAKASGMDDADTRLSEMASAFTVAEMNSAQGYAQRLRDRHLANN